MSPCPRPHRTSPRCWSGSAGTRAPPPEPPFDLDASALLCNGGRVLGDEWFVFYNNLKSPDGSVEHTGDNLTGEGDGDDESLLDRPLQGAGPRATRSSFRSRSMTPTTAARRSARSATPSSAWSTRRTARNSPATTSARTPPRETAMIFGELYRYGGEWKFRAVGQGYASGLRGIALDFGVNVS